jgi:ABC-type Fe3+-hydroxamate transport system substrate-binding protein
MAKEFIDQLHQTIRLDQKPHRIVSLVPSQTELLANLGLEQEVVGITKFCIYPEKWFNEKKRVGGTKTVDIEKVRQLQPDLIIGNKEENTASDIQALQSIAPVWMSDIETFEDALNMIQSIGAMCEKQEQATQLIQEISPSTKTILADGKLF